MRRSLLSPLLDRKLVRQFSLYVAVGVFGTLIDFGLFWALIAVHVWPAIAVTAAYFIATGTQFYLNRRYSFQAFDRLVLHQLGTFVVVTVLNWLLALAIVELGLRFGLTPLAAKALSIPPGAIVGFLGNRYLTFGQGIRETLRGLGQRRGRGA
jgi:putative flippase GtrA